MLNRSNACLVHPPTCSTFVPCLHMYFNQPNFQLSTSKEEEGTFDLAPNPYLVFAGLKWQSKVLQAQLRTTAMWSSLVARRKTILSLLDCKLLPIGRDTRNENTRGHDSTLEEQANDNMDRVPTEKRILESNEVDGSNIKDIKKIAAGTHSKGLSK